MIVRLTQIDGKLPNVALMKLAHWHRSRGDAVHFTRRVHRDMLEPAYDVVYGSCIFNFSGDRLRRFRAEWPDAIVGGTGSVLPGKTEQTTVEQVIGADEYEHLDYTDYPEFTASIGFTQRGCRLKCRFCVVPWKEGKPRSVDTIAGLWRGDPWPKTLHLLDNDFFGQPRSEWQARLAEIRNGGFRVCFSQGINVRLIDDEIGAELATIEYRDDSFSRRRLYTAWDNLKDEAIFFRGMDRLGRAGIPGDHIMAYMLIGFDPAETWDRILYRFNRMVERGIRPYPMVFDNSRRDLKAFQRWAVTGLYRAVPWEAYQVSAKAADRRQGDLLGGAL